VPTEAQDRDLDRALERVISAARAHLAAMRAGSAGAGAEVGGGGSAGAAAGDQADRERAVWLAFVELNNASAAYDDLLFDVYDEVTPWDLELISPEDAEAGAGDGDDEQGTAAGDVIDLHALSVSAVSVRHRRDYLVHDEASVLAAGSAARRRVWEGFDEDAAAEPVDSLGEAIYELVHESGSVPPDVEGLELTGGVMLVYALDEPLDAAVLDADPDGLFEIEEDAREIYRLDEVVR